MSDTGETPILNSILSVIWLVHIISGLYSVVSGGAISIITPVTLLAVLLTATTVFALNRKGGETVRKAGLVNAFFWSVLGAGFVFAGAWEWLVDHNDGGKLAVILGAAIGVVGGLTVRALYKFK